jgi:hypothetical protein
MKKRKEAAAEPSPGPTGDDTRGLVCQVLCFELGYELEDLKDNTRIWDTGVDHLSDAELDYLVESLEDGLHADFNRLRWKAEMVGKVDLTLAELIAWCNEFRH